MAYSEFDRQGREWAMNVMREAGLAVSIDAAGNIFGRRPGSVATLKPLVFGSHIDSVPDGGNYDGDVGSLSAIEVARTLAANNLVTRHPLEVVIFQNEEGGTVGSRALVGERLPTVPPSSFWKMTTSSGCLVTSCSPPACARPQSH